MPDAFGNPTPQEVLAQIQNQARASFARGQAGGPGNQAGSALAAIFGGSIRKTLDTRRAREQEAIRLMKTRGMSEDQAKQEAKSTIGREFAEVRRAQRVEEATSDMQSFVDSLPATVPLDVRKAQGKLMLSDRMRSMGLVREANALSAQAREELVAAEQAQLERENLKARTRASNARAAIDEEELGLVGTDSFQRLVLSKERIIGRLQDPNSQLTPQERDSLLRQKGHLEAMIAKQTTITGRTVEDTRADPTLMRKMFAEIGDNQVLVNNLDEAIGALQNLDEFEASVWANAQKDWLGFAERWFGRKPTESEQAFIDRIQSKQGKSALVAAKVRHALTGAQMSAFEIGFLAPFLPNPNDPVATQISKMRIVRDYTQLDTDTRMELFRQGLTGQWLENHSPASAANPLTDKSGTPSPEANSVVDGAAQTLDDLLPPIDD